MNILDLLTNEHLLQWVNSFTSNQKNWQIMY